MTSTLSMHLEDYLRLRRALGFKLEREGQLLAQFLAWLETADATTITADLAVAWAGQPAESSSNQKAKRLRAVRKFAGYLHTIDPNTEVPPPGVFPYRRHRPTPYLWSQRDIDRLLEAARALRRPLRAATHETLFGLLAVSGMRVGEAIGLERDDVDLATGVITIRHAKFDRWRLVPLHPTTTEALGRYAAVRDRLCPASPPARSSSPASARPFTAAASVRRSERSRLPSAFARRRSTRAYMISGTALLCAP